MIRRPRHLLRLAVLLLTAAAAKLPAEESDTSKSAAVRDPLQVRVDQAIALSSRRYLTADHHSPWQILHGMLALRQDLVINSSLDEMPKRIRAIDWITSGASFRGRSMFERTVAGGRARPFTQAYEFEGHPNQFLAILSMSRLPATHRFVVTRRGRPTKDQVSIDELVKHAQATVNDREEITWTLWALANYLPPETRWHNAAGEPWSIERMVRIQTREPAQESACGGTHGLYALATARNAYRRAHAGRVRGAWLEADQKLKRYIEEARLFQNDDGSFSASYFQGPHQSQDFAERLETSGHTLEWLMLAASPEQLQSEWVRRGVAAVAGDLVTHADRSAQCGPLYHALHGLVLYRERTRAATTD